MATLARRVAGIRAAHVERGFPDPTKGEIIRLTFRGIRRQHGKPQRRVAALTIDQLTAIVSLPGNTTRDIRDRALLLVGFAGAFRRSELGAIQAIGLLQLSRRRRLRLSLGMLGVILIFIWGPPQPSFDEGIAVALDSGTVLRDGTKVTDLEETALRQKRWHRAMSAIGLGFIFLGFAVQLWAVWPRFVAEGAATKKIYVRARWSERRES